MTAQLFCGGQYAHFLRPELPVGVPSPRFMMDIDDVLEMKYTFQMEIIEDMKASNGRSDQPRGAGN